MDKIDIVGLSDEKEAVVSALMKLGAVEISDVISQEKNEEVINGKTTEIEKSRDIMSLMKSAIEISDRYYKEKKPMFSSKRKVGGKKFEDTVNNIDNIIKTANRLNELQEKITAVKTKITKNQIIADRFSDWRDVDIDFENLSSTYTKTWIGSVPGDDDIKELEDAFRDDILESYIFKVKETQDAVLAGVVVWNEKEERAAQILKSSRFEPLLAGDAEGTPEKNYREALGNIDKFESEKESLINESREIARKSPDFEIIHDHSMIILEKALSCNSLEDTEYTFILRGWAPTHLTDSIKSALKKEFTIAFSARNATSEDEYPLLLKNHKLVKPYEVVTEMFSTPSVRDVDPTPIMAPFFLFFFSMMLSDAGYGLLLAGISALLIWKFKVKGNLRGISMFLFHGGLAAVIWGILFGGFFGDMITIMTTGEISFPTIWFNPIEDPTKLMIWSMIFGAIHVLAGLASKAFILIITGKIKDAVYDIFSWMTALSGAGVMAYGMAISSDAIADAGKYMIFAGLGVIILFGGRKSKNPIVRIFKGIGGLYDITGYFSDVLSYTRIVALSLATAVIAMVVNMLGAIAGFNIIGILMFIVVGIIGHAMNLAISALGCYVHTSRLQYVEFFSKFYEGGGRSWDPVSIKTEYIQLQNIER